MKISDISPAKSWKFKLKFFDAAVNFTQGSLLRIESTQIESEFLVNQYGQDALHDSKKTVLCKADEYSAQYISDLLQSERQNVLKCLFSIDGINESSVEVQAYTFQSITEYKTPIYIQLTDKILNNTNPEKLYKEYVWDQLGAPALFCLNYKNRKKQKSDVRFLSGRRYLIAHNTVQGIIAESETYLKDRDYLPIDVYVAPEIKFIPESENAGINNDLAKELEKVSNPQSYFARWEAYNILSQKLIEQESEEFGEIKYKSYVKIPDLTGTTFEFDCIEEIDSSFNGKELAVNDNSKDSKLIDVGAIKKIDGKRIVTYLEKTEGFNNIPDSGILKLNTIGDLQIMKRRDAARSRMMRNESPIKYIVPLIETGASEFNLSSDWSSHKPITEELKRNYKRAADLTPEQERAINIAINTPDIALIQGPPGTGKTTVIKAICERFREIFEAEERQLQKINPEHALRSPKILISSFQNEAVDNAISAPLPGDIPAYRKTGSRVKDSTKEQYQKALDKWYSGVYDAIIESIDNDSVARFVKERDALADEYTSYKNSGELLDKAVDLIKRYLSFPEIKYPSTLLNDVETIIKKASSNNIDDTPDPFVTKLEAQRTDIEAFNDDGVMNAKRFVGFMKIRQDDLNIADSDIKAVEAVCSDNFSQEAFKNYTDVILSLRKQYCNGHKSIDIHDKTVINECLITMSECFNTQYVNSLTDIDGKKSLILSEFLLQLEQEYEDLVRKYASTTAATCQTILNLRDRAQKVFDLVVIDEAARANPLDIFIPISMGKKIVLVGDHKQLPHMLEPDVIKIILDDPKFNGLPEIEKSLFERLFDMFSTGQNPKAIPLTDQFRMHPDICRFVSEAFYDSQLHTSKTVTAEMRSSSKAINGGNALTFVNIPIAYGAEKSGVSKSRSIEVEAVTEEVKKIQSVEPEASIGIITFYSAQAKDLRKSLLMALNDDAMSYIEIGTVDAFQGKEFEYVILSCVRSNNDRVDIKMTEEEKQEVLKSSVGFMTKPNRLCVAFSRAIKQLIVFGDVNTLMQIPCFARLYEVCAIEKGGCYREY